MADIKTTIMEFEELFNKRENCTYPKNIDYNFNELKYNIPMFQREYKWNEELVDTLLNDLSNKNSPLLGVIHLEYDKSKKIMNIIDGQQRITTIFLIIKELYNKMLNMGENPKFILKSIDIITKYNNESLTSLFINEEEKIILSFENDPYKQEKNLKNVEKTIEDFFKEYTAVKIIQIFDYIKNLKFIAVFTDASDTFIKNQNLFLDINEKGLHLDAEDIYKARSLEKINNKEVADEFIIYWQKLKKLYIESNKDFQIENSAHNEKNIVGSVIARVCSVYDKDFKIRPSLENVTEKLTLNGSHLFESNHYDESHIIKNVENIKKMFEQLKKNIATVKGSRGEKSFLNLNNEEKYFEYLLDSDAKIFLIVVLINTNDKKLNIEKLIMLNKAIKLGYMPKNKNMLEVLIKGFKNSTIEEGKKAYKEKWEILDLLKVDKNGSHIAPSNEQYFLENYWLKNLTSEHFIICDSLNIDIGNSTYELKNYLDVLEYEKIKGYKGNVDNFLYIDKNLNNSMKSKFFIEKIDIIKKKFDNVPNSIEIIFQKIAKIEEFKDLNKKYSKLNEILGIKESIIQKYGHRNKKDQIKIKKNLKNIFDITSLKIEEEEKESIQEIIQIEEEFLSLYVKFIDEYFKEPILI